MRSGSDHIADVGKELELLEDHLKKTRLILHEASVDVVSTEARLNTSIDNIHWLKEQWLAFADHKDSCEIRESADEGRIVEGIECTCGFEQLRVQFSSDLRR